MARIGAQMYTLRDHCKTTDDIARSCQRVKAMGYDGIQASAAGFGTLDTAQLKAIKKACDDNGLAVAATHESFGNMRDHAQAVIEKHQILGCQFTAIGGHNFQGEQTLSLWQDFAKEFSDVARPLHEAGLNVGYHNHNHEFVSLGHGQTPLSVLIEQCEPHIWFELDVYWVAAGFADPAQWIMKVADRCPCLHYKDGTVLPDRTALMTEIGEGNMNWPRINQAAVAAGVQWYLVERDRGQLDPFDSLALSIKNMRAMGL